MKTYKQLISQILNEQGLGGAFGGQVDAPFAYPATYTSTKAEDGININDVSDPEVINRLNAAMSYINKLPTMEPKTRVVEIKSALNKAGIDFNTNAIDTTKEQDKAQVVLFGGFIGMEDDGRFVTDDGFTRKVGKPYGVKFTFKLVDGLYEVKSVLEPM